MTKSTITREESVQAVFDLKVGYRLGFADLEILKRVARMALAAMDSEPVEMPLDYLQGHKDGLEWASQLAEANHPETGDWLYDDPIELAKAIRKGPDMLPVQPVADSEPVAEVYQAPNVGICAALGPSIRMLCPLEPGTKLYRHAQPAPEKYNIGDATMRHIFTPTGMTDVSDMQAVFDRVEASLGGMEQPAPVVPVVPDDVLDALQKVARIRLDLNDFDGDRRGIADCLCDAEEALIEVVNRRAAMLAAAPQSPGSEPATVPGKWIPVSERMPEVGDIVLTAMGGAVNVGEMECSAANCRFFTSVISGRELPATHWMPLPAGQKEDINALIPLVSRNEQEGK